YEALYARALSYAGLNVTDTTPGAKDLATKARDAALLGLKTLDELKKPDNMSDEDFKKQKQQPAILFNYTAGNAAMTLKNYPAAELNELLQLAGSSPERPEGYKLASAADISAAQKDMTIASVITDLKTPGDKSKLTWLAACGLEFPGVPGKAIEIVPGSDAVVLKIGFVTSDEDLE